MKYVLASLVAVGLIGGSQAFTYVCDAEPASLTAACTSGEVQPTKTAKEVDEIDKAKREGGADKEVGGLDSTTKLKNRCPQWAEWQC